MATGSPTEYLAGSVGEHLHSCPICNRTWTHTTASLCTWGKVVECNDCGAREDGKPSLLRILPASDDPAEAVAREVQAVVRMPLVGATKYVAVDRAVMLGSEWKATACSHTMARRIANALQNYTPGRKGY
jgi:hypothetical protein